MTLRASNMMSLFGLHRRLRGALVGHLAAVRDDVVARRTAATPAALRRLGGADAAARFFDEHVEADAVHEQIAAYELAGGLAAAEPALAADVLFGARCAAYTDTAFAEWVLPRWAVGQSSLLAETRTPEMASPRE